MRLRLKQWMASGAALSLLVAAPTLGALASESRTKSKSNERCESNERGGTRRGGRSLEVVGLTLDQRLICFKTNRPGGARTIADVSGLVGDTALVGIDFRVANNTLYGVGDAGGVYTIDTRSAEATKVSQLTIALAGTSFGVDVNPAADALRIISDTGQNLRFSFAAGTTTMDGTLTYPPATTPATGVAGAAYTNNDSSADTATTLFDIDSSLDQVAIQSPANSGQLVATGKLGEDVTAVIGFDIHTTVTRGKAVANEAFASLQRSNGRTAFHQVDLLTGDADFQGNFKRSDAVIAIALPLNQR